MIRKGLSFVVLLLVMALLSACAFNGLGDQMADKLSGGPSICEQPGLATKMLTDVDPNDSRICEVTKKMRVTPEQIGRVISFANIGAIAAGTYTASQALVVVQDVRNHLDTPVTYAVMGALLKKAMKDNPKMVMVAHELLDVFTDDFLISETDRK